MDVLLVVGVGEGMRAAYVGAKVAEHVAMDTAEHAGEDDVAHLVEYDLADGVEHGVADDTVDGVKRGCEESFAASTLVLIVLTPIGERSIASLKTGDTVTAYDPTTKKASNQTVEATSIHYDANLVDVTLKVATPAQTAAASADVRHMSHDCHYR